MIYQKTVKEIINELHNNDTTEYNFYRYVNNFLDYFYQEQMTELDRLTLFKDEPITYEDIPSWQYSFIAAMVHYLCLECNLQCPAWVMHKKYVLKDPYFPEEAYKDDNLMLKYLLCSPSTFKARNLFIDENIIIR